MTKHDRTTTTTVSTKGQVILPKASRERRGWKAGTRLVVEETPEGLLLKEKPVFAPTRPEDVRGMLHQPGMRAYTVREMDAAVDEMFREEYGARVQERSTLIFSFAT